MNRNKLYFGLLCLAVSYASYVLPSHPETHFLLGAFLMLGIISTCEFITRTYGSYSLTRDIRSSWRSLLLFVLATTIAGVVLESVYAWTLHLWVYPEWSPRLYAFLFVPGFIVYWLALLETYLAARILLVQLVLLPWARTGVAILVAATTTALVMEIQNLPAGLWRYTNWPLTLGTFMGLPSTMFLNWPVQYVLILLVLTLISPKKREVLFA